MEERKSDGWKGKGKGKGRNKMVSMGSYLYSKVIPKHLRTSSSAPSSAHLSGQKDEACTDSQVQTSSVTDREDRDGDSQGSRQRSRTMTDHGHCHAGVQFPITPCHSPLSLCHSAKPAGKGRVKMMATTGDGYSSVTVDDDHHNPQAAVDDAGRHGDEARDKDNGYCELKKDVTGLEPGYSMSSTQSIPTFRKRRWASERRAHKEEWRPLNFAVRGQGHSQLDVTPAARLRQGKTTDIFCLPQTRQQQGKPPSSNDDSGREEGKVPSSNDDSNREEGKVPSSNDDSNREEGKVPSSNDDRDREEGKVPSSNEDRDREREKGNVPPSDDDKSREEGQPLMSRDVQDKGQKGRQSQQRAVSSAGNDVFETVGKTTLTMEEACELVFPCAVKRHSPSTIGHSPSHSPSQDIHSPFAHVIDTGVTPPAHVKHAEVTSKHGRKRSDSDVSSQYAKHRHSSLSSQQHSATQNRDDEFLAMSILRMCCACQRVDVDLGVLQCFHLLCSDCTVPCNEDTVWCSLCGTQQAMPHEGIPLLTHFFPHLFDALPNQGEDACLPSSDTAQDSADYPLSQRSKKQPLSRSPPAAGLSVLPATEAQESPELEACSGVRMVDKDSVHTDEAGTAKSVTDSSLTAVSRCPDHLSVHAHSHASHDLDRSATPTKISAIVMTDSDSDDSDNSSTTRDSCSSGSIYIQRSISDVIENTHCFHTTSIRDSSDDFDNTTNLGDSNNCLDVSRSAQDISSRDVTSSTQDVSCSDVTRSSTSPDDVTQGLIMGQVCGACQTLVDTQHACITCGGIRLCARCHVAHLTLPVTRCHEVVPVSVSPSPESPLSPLSLLSHQQPMCAQHGQDLAWQCLTCAQLLCHRCVSPQHVQHIVQELSQLQKAGSKQLCGLQRVVKQHVLTANSAGRAVSQQLQHVRQSKREVSQAVQRIINQHLHRLTSQAQRLTRHGHRSSQALLERLTLSQSDILHVQSMGRKLRCLLNAVKDDTPHLTRLILHNTCQAWFDHLRQQTSMQVEEVERVVFCPNLELDCQLSAPSALGTVRTLVTSVPDTTLTLHACFHTPGEVSSLACTPFNEVVCLSRSANTCQTWHPQNGMLHDVSRFISDQKEVKVTPDGILVILGSDVSGTERKACVTFLSPSGSLLGVVPLSSSVEHTHIDCPARSRLLVSDEMTKSLTLYALTHLTDNPCLALLRRVAHSALNDPRQVTFTLTGDWLVNDQDYFMRVVSPEDDVTTVLTEDEPDAVLQPPQSSRLKRCRRSLSSVCCDSKGRMMAADVGKNGLYVATSSSAGRGECHFLSLQELASSSHVTAMTVDKEDRLIVGMRDGTVFVLIMG